jgi:hypothetical protein
MSLYVMSPVFSVISTVIISKVIIRIVVVPLYIVHLFGDRRYKTFFRILQTGEIS